MVRCNAGEGAFTSGSFAEVLLGRNFSARDARSFKVLMVFGNEKCATAQAGWPNMQSVLGAAGKGSTIVVNAGRDARNPDGARLLKRRFTLGRRRKVGRKDPEHE